MTLTAILTPAEEGGYIASNPETGTTPQGETVDEAVANLREATELYLEEFTGKATPADRLDALKSACGIWADREISLVDLRDDSDRFSP